MADEIDGVEAAFGMAEDAEAAYAGYAALTVVAWVNGTCSGSCLSVAVVVEGQCGGVAAVGGSAFDAAVVAGEEDDEDEMVASGVEDAGSASVDADFAVDFAADCGVEHGGDAGVALAGHVAFAVVERDALDAEDDVEAYAKSDHLVADCVQVALNSGVQVHGPYDWQTVVNWTAAVGSVERVAGLGVAEVLVVRVQRAQ